jgi:hypothetical protein
VASGDVERAADLGVLVDQQDARSGLGRMDGTRQSGRSGADDDDVV